jgi:competence protein ComEA
MNVRALEQLVFGQGDDRRVVRRGEVFAADAELGEWLVIHGKAAPTEADPEPEVGTDSDVDAEGRLRLNVASAERIDEFVSGIGPETAAKVVSWREANGPFASIDALLEIDGIGKSTLAKARKRLTVE